MSITATSGLWARTLRSRSSASPAWATTSKPASSSSRAAPSRRSTASSAITMRMESPRAAWCRRRTGCPRPACRRARRGGRQAAQPGAGRRVGAAAAVVADLDAQASVAAHDLDLGALRVGIAGDVRQRLGDHEVGGGLDGAGKRSSGAATRRDGDGAAPQEGIERRPQAALGERRRVDAARQLAQLGGRLVEVVERGVEQLARLVRVCVDARRGPCAGRAPARPGAAARRRAGRARGGAAPCLGGLDDTGARGAQLASALAVGDVAQVAGERAAVPARRCA